VTPSDKANTACELLNNIKFSEELSNEDREKQILEDLARNFEIKVARICELDRRLTRFTVKEAIAKVERM